MILKEGTKRKLLGTLFTEEEQRNHSNFFTAPALDSRNKKRWVGAFTGGLSAGYRGTVGSKKGFAPKNVDALNRDGLAAIKQSIFDFCDEQDRGDLRINSSLLVKRDFAHRVDPLIEEPPLPVGPPVKINGEVIFSGIIRRLAEEKGLCEARARGVSTQLCEEPFKASRTLRDQMLRNRKAMKAEPDAKGVTGLDSEDEEQLLGKSAKFCHFETSPADFGGQRPKENLEWVSGGVERIGWPEPKVAVALEENLFFEPNEKQREDHNRHLEEERQKILASLSESQKQVYSLSDRFAPAQSTLATETPKEDFAFIAAKEKKVEVSEKSWSVSQTLQELFGTLPKSKKEKDAKTQKENDATDRPDPLVDLSPDQEQIDLFDLIFNSQA